MLLRLRYLAYVPLLVIYMLHAARAQEASTIQPPAALPDVCEITGTVAALQQVTRSPWGDGTPSALSTQEVDVAVVIDARMPHDKAATGPGGCISQTVHGKKIIYKLCSPTQVKTGDTIHGVEGLATVDAYGVGCLFDVAVMPKS